MCRLDSSKVLMYEFYYDFIKNKYGNNSRLSFTHTNNLMCGIETDDVYEYFIKDEEVSDFNNCSIKLNYYDDFTKLNWIEAKDVFIHGG